MEKLFKEREAAEVLGVSIRTLYTWREQGLVPFRRLPPTGKKPGPIRYRISDLERVGLIGDRKARGAR